MMCQRIGWPPTITMGFGLNSVSARSRVPWPPQRIMTFMRPIVYHACTMQTFKEPVAKLAQKFGVKLVSLKTHNSPRGDMDPAFRPLFEACKPYTLIHVERMYSLYKAVQYIVKKGIQGDFVECGVWKGGASMMMAKTLLLLGETHRKIYLYDTYEGMTEPTP